MGSWTSHELLTISLRWIISLRWSLFVVLQIFGNSRCCRLFVVLQHAKFLALSLLPSLGGWLFSSFRNAVSGFFVHSAWWACYGWYYGVACGLVGLSPCCVFGGRQSWAECPSYLSALCVACWLPIERRRVQSDVADWCSALGRGFLDMPVPPNCSDFAAGCRWVPSTWPDPLVDNWLSLLLLL